MSLEMKNITFGYDSKVPILNQVNLTIHPSKITGLVAPSGYGKSTLGQIAGGYLQPQLGQVLVDGKELKSYKGMLPVQVVHQHPEQSVNIRWKIHSILNEGWQVNDEMKKIMGIKSEWMSRFPTELSGGELQRVCLARVLSPNTKYLIADEITTMIDAITQVEICGALKQLATEKGVGILFISHDRQLLDQISDEMVELKKINKA